MTEEQIKKLTKDELLNEINALESLIYETECYGIKDIVLQNILLNEADSRELQLKRISKFVAEN